MPSSFFTRTLRHWHLKFNDRKMPWKGEKDPYRIWLSEIILQQTRVEQGLKYYQAFVREFPDIHKLAAAREEKVFKLWEGLGYYSRCRNLIQTAREISKKNNGQFPDRYESIRKLKGVGPYTAAAISSFAFQMPFAVVDGNVIRVLSRVFGVEANAATTKGRAVFDLMAAELLDKKDPATHNQAIMDFGATICKPVAPLCASCGFRQKCFAFTNDRIDSFPVKLSKPRARTRWFYFMVHRKNGKLAVRKRSSGDIWEGLYEFPSVESAKKLSLPKIQETLGSLGYFPVKPHTILRQQLTHQKIEAQFFIIETEDLSRNPTSFTFKTKRELDKLAFPKMLREFLKTPDLFG